jgi:hypothetical protein
MAEKRYENKEMQRHYDRTRKAEPNKTEEEGYKTDLGEHEESETPIEDVVRDHGPAKEAEVLTTHEDGHVHKSKHHDHKSASEHMRKAMGGGMEEPRESEEELGGGSAMPMPTMKM